MCLAVLLLPLSLSFKSEEASTMEKRFYDFKPGTEWVFNATFNGSLNTEV